MTPPMLRSIQVALPQHFGTADATDPMDRPWTTAVFKRAVSGPVRLGLTNLAGDEQADRVYHGGPDKAVMVYAADHYDRWRRELAIPDLPFGAFGENFTVEGLTEANVCLDDVWQVGEAVVQVAQPRQPCWKLARRWRIKTLALKLQETGRTGWYFRVLKEGVVAAGMTLGRLERPHPTWTIERMNQVMHFDKNDLRSAAELAAIASLPASWKTTLLKRVEHNVNPDPAKRLFGPNEP